MQRFELSPNDVTELLLREPLLIVRLSILNPFSHTQRETGKRENLSRLYLCLEHSTLARCRRSCPSQDGTPFLIPHHRPRILSLHNISSLHFIDLEANTCCKRCQWTNP